MQGADYVERSENSRSGRRHDFSHGTFTTLSMRHADAHGDYVGGYGGGFGGSFHGDWAHVGWGWEGRGKIIAIS